MGYLNIGLLHICYSKTVPVMVMLYVECYSNFHNSCLFIVTTIDTSTSNYLNLVNFSIMVICDDQNIFCKNHEFEFISIFAETNQIV